MFMKCNNCGAEITDKNAVNCPQCGQKIKKSSLPVWAIVLIILAGLFICSLPIIGIVAAMVLPTLMSSTEDAKNKTVYKKTISTLSQSMYMSEALDGGDYTNFDDVWTKKVKANLLLDSENGNIIRLKDLTEIKYDKLSDVCQQSPQSPSKETACAVLTIDADGFDKGLNMKSSKETGSIKVNDQFELLLYKNAVMPAAGSIEEELINY